MLVAHSKKKKIDDDDQSGIYFPYFAILISTILDLI